ncbi:MFS transporter [Lactobacillus sp. CBA3605]|uniref:MFS transporter n=1 Tax=Lactobacillus sp. CBA3605 TaxID=2099788 RepID=UPI000CFA9418|nr:MFS transporter [Lactobacillus sp. CBA3605]AVK61243.1 MFS transporter [Lactobacillus sp. CBA3605]
MDKKIKSILTPRDNQIPYIVSMAITFFCFYGFSYLVSVVMVKETRSPDLLGKVLTLTMLPAAALNLLAGRVVKYLGAKLVMIITDLLTGILFIMTFFLMELSVETVVLLVVVSVLNKSIGVFYKLSNKTIIPLLFVEDEILHINSVQTQIRQLAIIISSVLVTGLLVLLNPKFIIFIIGALFLLSVVFDFQLQQKIQIKSEVSQDDSDFQEIKDSQRGSNLLFAALGCFVDSLVVVLIPWLSLVVLKSSWILSILLICEAIGILLAPVCLKVLPTISLHKLSLLLPVSLLLLYPYFPIMACGMFSLGLIRGMFNIQFFSQIQQEVSLSRMSHTMGNVLAITDASTVVGTLGAAKLSSWFGQSVFVTIGIVLEIFILIILYLRKGKINDR